MCDYKMENIWQISQISLPFTLSRCTCLITQQSTKQPKLIILGGQTATTQITKTYLEYNISDIIGYDKFKCFMIDVKQVKYA